MAIQLYHIELTINKVEDFFNTHFLMKKIGGNGKAQFQQDFKVFSQDLTKLDRYLTVLKNQQKGVKGLAPSLIKRAGQGDGRWQVKQSIRDRCDNYNQLIERIDKLMANMMLYIRAETQNDPTNHEGKKVSQLLEELAGEIKGFTEKVSSQQIIEGFKSLFNGQLGKVHAEVGVADMPILKPMQEKTGDPVTMMLLGIYTLALWLRSKGK